MVWLFFRCSWSGLSFRLQHILFNFLDFPFPLSLYPLLSVESVWYFRLALYIYITTGDHNHFNRMHLRMASSRLSKRTLNTKWVLSTLHMVILSSYSTSIRLTIHRRWSISCTPFCHILCPITNILVVSLSCLVYFCPLEHGHSCRRFQISTAGRYVYGPISTPKKN